VARGVGRVSEERGKDDNERLVVIRSEQQEKNDGEGKEAAALQTELGIDRLDGGLEGKSEMFEGGGRRRTTLSMTLDNRIDVWASCFR